VKKLVIIGTIVALVVTMLPAVVWAGDGDIDPSTYSTIPLGIVGSFVALVGRIVGIIGEATSTTVFGIPLMLQRIGVFVARGFADPLNTITVETTETAGDVAEIVGNETSLNTGWLVDIFRTIACAFLTPFGAGNCTEGPLGPCG
jgi:hypothetical protein